METPFHEKLSGMAVSAPIPNKVLAWLVHSFTASGAFVGLLAIVAIAHQQWILSFAWMLVAVIIDGIDGTLARKVRVNQVIPTFDGALLDNMVDYLNYAIVPAFFLYQAELLPGAWAITGVGAIALTSAYQFCQADAKTDDHYFKGFPSYWNIVAFYVFILGMSPWINLALTLFLSLMVFVPLKYIYPSRTSEKQRLTLFFTLMWGATCVLIVTQYPHPPGWLVAASLLYVVYYVGISLFKMKAARS